jgi:hypothetical protein
LKARKKKHAKKKTQKRRTRRKLSVKRAVKAAARMLWKHLVELPEKEREQNIAVIERMLTKKFKRATGKK